MDWVIPLPHLCQEIGHHNLSLGSQIWDGENIHLLSDAEGFFNLCDRIYKTFMESYMFIAGLHFQTTTNRWNPVQLLKTSVHNFEHHCFFLYPVTTLFSSLIALAFWQMYYSLTFLIIYSYARFLTMLGLKFAYHWILCIMELFVPLRACKLWLIFASFLIIYFFFLTSDLRFFFQPHSMFRFQDFIYFFIKHLKCVKNS